MLSVQASSTGGTGGGRRVRRRGGMRKSAPRRRFRRRGVNTSKVKSTLGFPDRMITKLEYRTKGIFAYTGTDLTYDFRLNSIYDPDITSVGHQPMWSDEYQAIYKLYRVFRCKYELKLVALSTGGTPGSCVTMANAMPQAQFPNTIAGAWEQNRTANRLIPSGTDNITTIRGNISLPYLQGQTNTEFKGDDGNFAILASTNPTNDAILRILFASVNGNDTQYAWEMKLTYFTEIFERVIPHPS